MSQERTVQVCARKRVKSLFHTEILSKRCLKHYSKSCISQLIFWHDSLGFLKEKSQRRDRFQKTTHSTTCHWFFPSWIQSNYFETHFLPHNNRFRMKAHNMAKETHILSSMLSCESIWTSSYVANTMKIFPLSVTRDFQLTWWWTKFSLHIFMKADLHLGILSYNHECIQIENRQSKLCLELYISNQSPT